MPDRPRRSNNRKHSAALCAALVAFAGCTGLAFGNPAGAATPQPATPSMVDATLGSVSASPAATGGSTLKGQSAEAARSSQPGLSVTVGNAVTIEQSADGQPATTMFVTNAQVSGAGYGNIVIPVGTDAVKQVPSEARGVTEADSLVYYLSPRLPDEVQSMQAHIGTYAGSMPITVSTSVSLDGKQVDPQSTQSLSGDVKITYTVTNTTGRTQSIVYRDATGREQSAQQVVPVPFVVSFKTTLGSGWARVESSGSELGSTDEGQLATGLLVMFPPLGEATQTVEISARADHAHLPTATFEAMPLDLDDVAGGQAGTDVQKAAAGAQSAAATAARTLAFQMQLQQLSEAIDEANRTYVLPLVAKVDEDRIPVDRTMKVVTTSSKAVKTAGDLAVLSGVLTDNARKVVDELAETSLKSDKQIKEQAERLRVIAALASAEAARLETEVVPRVRLITAEAQELGTLDPDALKAACSHATDTNNVWRGLSNSEKAAVAGALGSPLGERLVGALELQSGDSGGSASSSYNALKLICPEFADSAQLLTQTIAAANLDLRMSQSVTLMTAMGRKAATAADRLDAIAELQKKRVELKLVKPCKIADADPDLSGCGLSEQLRRLSKADTDIGKIIDEALRPAVRRLLTIIPQTIALEKYVDEQSRALADAAVKTSLSVDEYSRAVGGLQQAETAASTKSESMANNLSLTAATIRAMDERVKAGDGAPFGNATGTGAAQGNVTTLAAWRIMVAGVSGAQTSTERSIALALLLMISAAVPASLIHRQKARRAKEL